MKKVYPDGLPTPQRFWSMLAIGLGIAMSVLDSSIANVALPAIASELSATPAASVWVVNAYQLAILTLLLPLAALGERIGYRRVYLAGLAIFTVGSLGCALSGSLQTLVTWRVIQGFGATGIMSMNGALVRYTYPHRMLGRGVGLNALVVSIAAATGPTIASGILAIASWEWLFAVNVPIAIFNLIVATHSLPYSNLSPQPFNWMSAVLNALMFGLFFIGLDSLAHGGASALLAAAEIALAAIAGVALALRESRTFSRVIPVDLLRIPVFTLSVVASVCAYAAYMAAFVALPFYFEIALHRDQVQTGLLMTPWPVALGLVAPLAGRLSDRVPAAILGTAGLALLTVGLALLAILPADATAFDIGWRMAVCGLGFGFFQAPNNRTLLSAGSRERAGAAGGMLAAARLAGMTAGASLAAFAFRAAPQHAEPVSLFAGAALAVLAAAASLARLPKQREGIKAASRSSPDISSRV
ncbi:MAG TPA: MFS transporter [Hyphomicrobiales bacterium]|nr:MFS transporter [Hyphomicrobiales bacterium]